MAPPVKKKLYRSAILGVLSGAVVVVMLFLAYLLFTLPVPDVEVTPTAPAPAFSLPTAPAPTATSGPPPSPLKPAFAAEQPVQGFSNCSKYGFWGVVADAAGGYAAGVQVVVWEDRVGLLAMGTTDARGNYRIELEGAPALRKLWLQLYRNDMPVSEPALLQTQIDCRQGFQMYQVDWRGIE